MSISFSAIAVDVWQFIKRPRLHHLREAFQSQPVQILGYLLLLDFLLMIPLSGFLGVLGIENMDHKIEDLTDDPLKLAGLAVVMAPLLEEVVFRLPMKFSYSRMMLALGIALSILPALIASEATVGIIAGMILFSVFAYHFINQQKSDRLNQQFGSWWERYFPIPFWGLTTAFALVHLSNFGDFPMHLAPLLVLPQFVLGAILGYIRTGLGFVYAVLFHALHNGILVGLAILAGSAEDIETMGWLII